MRMWCGSECAILHPIPMKETTPHILLGEPAASADVRALAYLDAITAHFLEFGPLEKKTAFHVAYELSHHNAWHQFEVAQERKAGEKTATYQEITLYHLRALSQRKVQAMAESGAQEGEAYRVVCFIDGLLAEAVAAEEEIERPTDALPETFVSLHETPETPF